MPMVVPMGVSDTIVLPSLGSAMTIAARPERPIRSPFLARLGDGPQTEYPVRHTLTIGRLPNNDVVLDDPKVSRRHTELIVQDGIVVARDLQSANGTQVNGQSITRDQPLHNGDVVTVGDTTFAFHNDYEVARPRLVTPEGREYPLKDNMTIGRLPNNDIVLNDPKASRHHAEIELQNGRVVIRDLESLNGTEVNGAPISSEQPLSEGDTVSIGDTSLVYKSDFAPVPA
jgi:pSer/pThr/pTyr-binding forkhead associated (FHA) protein